MPFISAFNGSFYIRLLGSAAGPVFGDTIQTVDWNVVKGSVESTVDSWGFYPVGYTFNDDGTKAYVTTRTWQTGTANDPQYTQVSVAQYILSSPYDLGTATYDTINNTVVSGLMAVNDILWNNDGTKAYLSIAYENTYNPISNRYQVWECASTLPFDVSGIQISSPTNTIVVPTEATSLSWNNDGTKLFATVDYSFLTISCTTPYSLSGATTSTISPSTIGLTGTRYRGLEFSDDGLVAWIANWQNAPNNTLYKLELSSAYDLSSSTSTETHLMGSQYSYDIDYRDNKVIVFGGFDTANPGWRYYESGLPEPSPTVEPIVIDSTPDFSNTTLAYTLDNPTPYGTGNNDYFGVSVAISSNYAIVGANAEDDASGSTSGKAYIFDVSDGSLVYTLDNPNAYSTSTNDYFGNSVSISNTHAIVSAWGEDEVGGSTSGKAYIFDLSNGSLLHTLDNPNAYGTSDNDRFGYSVAISSNYAIAGAYGEDYASGTSSGKAYIFDVSDGSLLYTLDNPTPSSDDEFGRTVSISDTHAIVGAYGDGSTNSGKAYIFDLSDGSLAYTLNNPTAYDTSSGDWFGWSVAISSNYAIVGAYQEDDAGGFSSGKAYIFDVSDGSLVYTLDNPNAYSTSNADNFGYSVSISDTQAIVGAYYEDDADGTNSGKAYIFDLSDGSLAYTLDNPNAYGTSDDDRFGQSVAISSKYAIAGAFLEDDVNLSGPGKAYIFQGVIPTAEATMIKRAYIDTSDANVEYDYYGGDIKILDNGTKILYSGDYRDGSNNVRRDLRIATLNTPYDISSSTTATGILEIEDLSGYPMLDRVAQDHWISDDGMTLYLMFRNSAVSQTYWYRSIYKFSLSSAWDITTVTSWNPTQQFTLTDSTASEEAAGMDSSNHFPISFWFNNDGSKLFVYTGHSSYGQDTHLLEYPLSSAYDLTSAGTRSWHRFSDTGPVNQLQGGIQFTPGRIEFNDDGTKLYGVFTDTGFRVGMTSWTLETAWDISTLSKDAWEQDISDSYVDDNGDVLGASTRGTFPTAFANNYFYITDIFHTNPSGLDTNAIYQWDMNDIVYTYSGNRVIYEYSITNDTQSNTIDEGDTVVFTISAPDIPDGSTIYWEVDPYSFTEIDDFDPETLSGTATFSNGTATVTVNVLNDILDETNQNESFNIRTARNQNVYYSLGGLVSSNIISIGEVPWISLDHTIQTPGLATNDTLGGIKMDKGINDTYTVIASALKDDGSNSSSGEVYLYNNNTGALERTFTNPNAYNTTTGDQFGYAVSLSDSYLIAGAWGEDSTGGTNSGKAYVFNLSDGSLKYTLNNPNTYGTEADDGFGTAVSITDDYAIVGAYNEDSGTFGQNSGAAYIFDMSDGSLAYTLTNPDSEPGTEDWFGFSVSINQHYAAVGAPKESYDTSAINTGGKAYLYRLDTGALIHTIDNPGSNATYNANDQFGWDVALTNKHLIVGANQATTVDDSGTNTNAGKVSVFNLRDGTHLYTRENRPFGGINDYFGDTVDGSDNFLIAGTRDLDGTNNGGAYIYNINSGDYMTTLTNPNTYSGPNGDRFGTTVAILDNGTAAVSARGEDTASTTDSGAFYIYSSTYTGPTGVYTYKGIGDRGLIWGGTNSTYDYKIQYFDITTLGDAADFGTRYGGGGYAATMSNSVRGMWAGGSTQENPSQGGANGSIHYVTTATLSNAYMWSASMEATAWSAGVSDGDRGVFFGGPEDFDDATTFMNYISMSVASYQSTDFGDLVYAAAEIGGAGDATYGIKAGGFYNDTYKYRRAEMEKFTIQTTGSAAYLGDLTQARRKLTGTSNGTRGLFAGGIDASNDLTRLNIIDYLTIATDTSATDFGDLADNTQGVSACSNETRAVFGGGTGDAGNIDTLQYVSYDTPGNTSAFGSLVAGTNNEGGSGLSGASA